MDFSHISQNNLSEKIILVFPLSVKMRTEKAV